MTVLSRVVGRLWKLQPAEFAVELQRGISVPMRDGAALVTDIYHPQGATSAPTILMRSPYGRGSVFGLFGRLFAERGYTSIVQSVRGTFGSGGKFNPFFQERDDGLDTVTWIERQPWYNGKLGLHGASYLGQVHWAVAAELGNRVAAMTIIRTTSDFHAALYDGDGFRLEDFLKWTRIIATQERTNAFLQALSQQLFGDPLKRYYRRLPLRTLDERAIGQTIDFWRTWVDHDDPNDPIWKGINDFESLQRVTAPVNFVAGWSDVFLGHQMRDYLALKRFGKTVRLKIGPWTHVDFGGQAEGVREGLDWFEIHLKGRAASTEENERLRLWVNGPDQWRDYREWPSNTAGSLTLNLGADKVLSAGVASTGVATFRYNPKRPTPSFAGPKLTDRTGRGDMRRLAARRDVLAFDGAVLSEPVELIGNVDVVLTTSASSPYYDLFVCLCDVDPNGQSINITDGYRRLRSASDTKAQRSTAINLMPVAWRVPAGHRLRLLVAAGAFPRYARNLGLGEPLGSAQKPRKVEIVIHCGGDEPSTITFPMRT